MRVIASIVKIDVIGKILDPAGDKTKRINLDFKDYKEALRWFRAKAKRMIK